MRPFSYPIVYAILALGLVTACQTPQKEEIAQSGQRAVSDPKAQAVVDSAIIAHGGELFDQSQISFDFRDRHYVATRNNGQFTYERMFTDSIGQKVHDILTNDGFSRTVAGKPVTLTDERKNAFSNSVNSVIYFALLPYFLNDPAAQKTYIGESTMDGELYDKVQVTFQSEGGGTDHDDVYVYWFHRDRHTMDFLGYSFQTNRGGARFRKAVNPQVVGGIRFADYVNLAPIDSTLTDMMKMDSLYQVGGLKEFSRIENKNIQVEKILKIN